MDMEEVVVADGVAWTIIPQQEFAVLENCEGDWAIVQRGFHTEKDAWDHCSENQVVARYV